jgi:hypothetical protein
MQTWSEISEISHNIIVWVHKHLKKISNDFEQQVLYIAHRDEHLLLCDNGMCGDAHHHFLKIT